MPPHKKKRLSSKRRPLPPTASSAAAVAASLRCLLARIAVDFHSFGFFGSASCDDSRPPDESSSCLVIDSFQYSMNNYCVRHIHTSARRRIIGPRRRCHLPRHEYFPRHYHSGLAKKRSSQSRRGDDGAGGGDYYGGNDDALPPPNVLIPIAFVTSAASIYAYRSCLDDVPYTNRRRLLVTSAEFEAKLGHEMYDALLEKHRGGILHESHGASVAVKRVGSRIASAAERCKREWTAEANANSSDYDDDVRGAGGGGESSSTPPPPPYTYTVIRSPEANAFVLPGNHVFVLTGLFRYVRDEDDLASVLGHEMAHNLARHAGERVSESVFLAILRRLSLFVDPSGMLLLAFVIPAEALLWTLPHSRMHEMEADRIGMILAGEACYDPRAAGRVFSRMREDEERENGGKSCDDDLRGGGGGSSRPPPPEWISTHPGYETRLSQFDRWMPDALERFELDGGDRCRSIREEMKRARRLAAEMRDGREGSRKRND